MTQLLIIGGSDAGISAAIRAREVDPAIITTVMMADTFPNYSICGLPFYISGEVPDWRSLAHRTRDEIESEGIRLLLNHTARSIHPDSKTVQVEDAAGQVQAIAYDRLVIATGAVPIRPPIEGIDLPGVYLLHTMEDSFHIHEHLTERDPKTVLIVGGGYIGLEMADALRHRGMQVTLVEMAETVLPVTVDTELGRAVEDELRRNDVEVICQVAIESIHSAGSRLAVSGLQGFQRIVDLVLVVVGVRPFSELAVNAGIQTGVRGAIHVSRKMETSAPDIYAAGDCVETWHHVANQNTYMPLGTTAHKQGRIAGENAAGGRREFAGSLGTQVVKVFDLAIARTGLREKEASESGFYPFSTAIKTWNHKAYYPGAQEILIRVTGDQQSGRLLGAQMLGHWQSEIAKRIDIFATALFHEMKLEEIANLDLSYTPPFSSPWDPVQISAQAWVKAQENLVLLNKEHAD